jgi:hypothetical protein
MFLFMKLIVNRTRILRNGIEMANFNLLAHMKKLQVDKRFTSHG